MVVLLGSVLNIHNCSLVIFLIIKRSSTSVVEFRKKKKHEWNQNIWVKEDYLYIYRVK